MKNIFLKLLPKEKIKKIEDTLNVKVKNKNVWLNAIAHKSWLFFHPEYKLEGNERLEFLGDSILQAITSWYLYRNFTNLNEGKLSLIRAALVNRERLGEIALKLRINQFLLIGKNFDERGLKTILGNSLEAIIGAIFIDNDFNTVKEFIEKNILKDVKKIYINDDFKDPKTILQEFLQKEYDELPNYILIEEKGPAHKKNFKIGLYFKDKKISEGQGRSKQEAEFKAAEEALKIIKKLK